MISLLICSRIAGNENWGLPKLLKGLKEMSSDYRNFEVLLKFDTDDERVPDVLPTLREYPFRVKYLVEPRGRGYIDLHIGYNRLMSMADPHSVVMGAFADDFVITVKGWDDIILSQTRQFADNIYIIHQRPHPPYYRKNYKTEPFYVDFSLDHLDTIEIIDEGPFWSRRLLEICGGLGHVSFTDAWTLCLEWYLYHLYGINRTIFLRERIIHRTLHENIDTRKAARWSTDRSSNFTFIQSSFFRTMVQQQALNVSLNILAERKSRDLISRADDTPDSPDNRCPGLLQRLLETAQGALESNRPDAAVLEFTHVVQEFPDAALAHYGLGVALLAQSRFGEAIPALQRAIQLAPEHPGFNNSLGVALYYTGDFAGAEAAFLAELRLVPDNVDAQLNLVKAYCKQGRVGDAIARLERLATTAPRDKRVVNALRSLEAELTQMVDIRRTV